MMSKTNFKIRNYFFISASVRLVVALREILGELPMIEVASSSNIYWLHGLELGLA